MKKLKYLVLFESYKPNSTEVQKGPTSSTSANTATYVEGKSLDHSIAQKKALEKLKILEKEQGKLATKLKEQVTRSGSDYICRIDYRFD